MTFFHDFWRNCTSRCIGYGDSMNNVFVYMRTDRGYGNRHKNLTMDVNLYICSLDFTMIFSGNKIRAMIMLCWPWYVVHEENYML